MQLKWIWPIAVLIFFSAIPSKMGGLKFIPIYEAVVIRAQKSAPPYVAFEEVHQLKQKKTDSEWARFDSIANTFLLAGGGNAEALTPKKINTQKIVLAEMVIEKKPELIQMYVEQEQWKQQLTENLSNQQRRMVAEAQRKSDILDQDWSTPSWSDEVQRQLASAGYVEKQGRIVAANPPGSLGSSTKPTISAVDAAGNVNTEVPKESVSFVPSADTIKKISGPLEITGGLAVTNEHYIEIRRTNEGIAHEIGRVDLQKGTYNISVQDASGTIEAKLVDKIGKVLGEGSIRIARFDFKNSEAYGPKLKIEPSLNFAGHASDIYGTTVGGSAPTHTIATLMRGAQEFPVSKDGRITLEKMAKGSSTVLRVAAPKYMQTASLVFSGEDFNASMFPTSMIQALKEIVTNEKITPSSESSLEAEVGAVVWGKVSQDGKAIAGIQVRVESDESAVPIYFNQFMLPDPKLTATSDNGLYAFVNVTEGFHALLATRGESFFGYQNAIVESGSVALAEIENSIRIESVPLRTFDAFTGVAQGSNVTLQSIDHEIEVPNGNFVLSLPQIHRLGLIRVAPQNNDYLPARYFYSDKDSYIHLPLLQWSWLSSIKSFLKIDDSASTGVVVGFVPDENFEVFLAGSDRFEKRNIVYFDMQGKILQQPNGIAGGGFILYNVPADIHEVVVLGSKTNKIFSRVLPVDVNTLSVLSFRE